MHVGVANGASGSACKSTTSASAAPLGNETMRARADALLEQMTPEEKAGQLSQNFYLSIFPPLVANVNKSLEQGGVGSLLFVTDPAETNRLQKIVVEKSRLKIPLLFGFDVIHGLHTIFPVPLGMAASWDPKMVEQAQSIAAAEARAVGIHWAFAPNVDIARDPRWGRIVEGAGEDPYLGSAVAAAQVRGFQGPFIGSAHHIIAGPKHFAGYGAALGGRDYDEVNLSDNELWNVYLPPFKAAVDAGTGNIMSAYMDLNGVPASSNQWLLTKVLRDTWGFKGFVVSDSGAVTSLITQSLAADAEDAAVRVLQAARLAAERSAVLLRNDNGVLPLERSLKAIAVIGPLADSARDTLGPWIFPQNNPKSVSVLAGLHAKLGKSVRIDYSEGVRMPARLHPSPFVMLEK